MIYTRIGVRAAYITALALYKNNHQAAVEAVARELCIDPAVVEEALAPEMTQ
jgi:hypothetical protein